MSCFSNISRKYFQKKRNIKRISFIFFLLFPASNLFSFFIPISGDGDEFYLLIPNIYFWGFEADVCWRLENGFYNKADTIFSVTVGTNVSDSGYYRDINDKYSDNSDLNHKYTDLRTLWGLGFEQGILKRPNMNKNLLAAHFNYRGLREWNFNKDDQNSVLFDSNRPDKDGIFLNTFIASLIYDDTVFNNISGEKKGPYIELSYEAGPAWFFNQAIGNSNFHKVFFEASYFLPVYEADNKKEVLQSIYFAGRTGVDIIMGDKIPLVARQTFGVMDSEHAIGGSIVRGFEKNRFDSEIKWANNIELRLIGRRIDYMPDEMLLRPGILLFFDYALFSGLDGFRGDDSFGMIASAGFGIFAEIFIFGDFFLYGSFPVIGKRIDENIISISFGHDFNF